MANARRKEGLRAPLFFIAASVILLLTRSAIAQTVDRSDLQRCAALTGTELKLACFEALAAPAEPEPDTAHAATETAAAVAAGTAIATVAKPALGSEPTPDPAPAAETAAQTEPLPAVVDVPAAEPAAAVAVAATAATPASAETAEDTPHPMESVTADVSTTTIAGGSAAAVPDDYGEEHLKRQSQQKNDEQDEAEVVIAKVQKVTTGYANKLYFHFENGQVWRQQASGYIRYPKGQPFDVEITRGMMGDYQMRVDGEGRLTRIVRTQ